MTTTSTCTVAAMVIILLLTESNFRKIRDYIIFDRINIHCKIQVVPFADLPKMAPGEPSSAIAISTAATGQREEYNYSRKLADLGK
jgi:hypothetical protein